MKCFSCGAEGHLIRACPEARRENTSDSGRPAEDARATAQDASALGLGWPVEEASASEPPVEGADAAGAGRPTGDASASSSGKPAEDPGAAMDW